MDIFIVTGFTGSGKTTFLNQILPLYPGRKAVIENDIGEVEICSALLGEKAMMSELPTGCICCTLAVDLRQKIRELSETYKAEYIFIEPSGIGRLSDVIKICRDMQERKEVSVEKIRSITLLDISVFDGYLEDFGEFYTDQIEYADLIFYSYLDEVTEKEKESNTHKIKEMNPHAVIYEGDWRMLSEESIWRILQEHSHEGKQPEETEIFMNLTDRGIRKKRRIQWQR